MMRIALILALAAVAGCTAPTPMPIEFLSRSGCVQTKIMRARLDKAIEAIGKPIPYAFVDLDTLPTTDTRKGYPTPTILRGGIDIFGMPAPVPPFPEPT
jgi:hypothetical protein